MEILKWLTLEMDGRYRRLAQVKVHNIDTYNKSGKTPKPMPFIVLIVDELADLMMAKSDEIEPLLCRLAQMARAVGIHCVVATQRPSVDVITGLIKANFPTRISFAVASLVDSRTILDTIGAEKLLGRGDMLYLSAELSKPKRLQGCFASQQEIERVTRFWADQARCPAHRGPGLRRGAERQGPAAGAGQAAGQGPQADISLLPPEAAAHRPGAGGGAAEAAPGGGGRGPSWSAGRGGGQAAGARRTEARLASAAAWPAAALPAPVPLTNEVALRPAAR